MGLYIAIQEEKRQLRDKVRKGGLDFALSEEHTIAEGKIMVLEGMLKLRIDPIIEEFKEHRIEASEFISRIVYEGMRPHG